MARIKRKTLKRIQGIFLISIVFIAVLALSFFFFRSKSIEKCDSFREPERSICISMTARNYHSISLCSTSAELEACRISYAAMAKDYDLCEGLGSNIEYCVMNVAIAKEDMARCAGLGHMKEQCELRINQSLNKL